MKKLFPLLFIPLFFVFTSSVFAEELVITKIGALNVNGKYYNQWWYEPTRLTLEGTGSKGANVDIYLDDEVSTIKTSTEDGSWKYTHPTELEKRDYKVKVASGDKSYAFILTIGSASVPAEATSSTKGGLLEAGGVIPTLLLAAFAGFLIYYGFREKVV
ncbi:hypothetical protein A2334_02710 [Candidatus Roizmanbacteria bacterium RIFOXYB2_FULL_38_10]|uniref:Bacterial Ig-like domain-containing protein n=1 Tax=Candidatus Roizmanbacteria bacterium RIFOXYD1_FULL_38_12 TaxID=1802093 RepID=A0A1F7L0I2_9BACT|nr:MAG: hypothetical protein A3K47_02290 [Candidatus Roizmanbacteria bacterium RIFOXYA2_FULL_38_14]OGK63606.1 MAG: hypothetical protein A3K27_02290 [Candidatus Roizmanbacteria bacterium RIFOXYA1_FULL_37_12]OGK65452.1 MAG: hypothetical protein A3K38_02290 [Candidatus Roizmanbacteria bacterium RIFOXYB1_FULL_40_23]OGK69071.1 MAG: hypothetical protein A2334_02710 [Candidatus Roizmanbacteria bacterium RIFOXYB2_FULL_38_10]OGK69857.1 MAG: hypothetical protein A3K21_02295 [Candidatus Roizmanbacteria ba